MNKLSFRARALDPNKALPVYHADELPDLSDYNAINRAVPEMPTGMEKEEETEHHLQRAMAAQQLYGEAQQLVIPTPDFNSSVADYTDVYKKKSTQPRNFIRMHGYLDSDFPEYDLDDEDVKWCNSQKGLTELKLETMIETLEKGLGQQSQNLTLTEAQALLHDNDDTLVLTVFDYWQAKRARVKIPLMATVKQEKRDGSSATDYYVAFRRRTEKMQTRKNRKNDEASYERMCKLRRDLERSCQLLALIKQREQKKQDLINSMKDIFCHRNKIRDWNSSTYNSVIDQLFRKPSIVPPHPAQASGQMMQMYNRQLLQQSQQQQQMSYPGYMVGGHGVAAAQSSSLTQQLQHPVASVGETSATASDVSMPWAQQPTAEGADSRQTTKQKDRSKRKHHKKKHHAPTQAPVENPIVLPEEVASEEDHVLPLPPVEIVEQESTGPFAFKRRLHVQYCLPRECLEVGLPFELEGEADPAVELPSNKRYRLFLTSMGRAGPFLGLSRQRIGRGGRRYLDRGPWPYGGDEELSHSLQHGHVDVCDVNIQDPSMPYYQLDSPPPAKRVAHSFPSRRRNVGTATASSPAGSFLPPEERRLFAHLPITPVSSDEDDPESPRSTHTRDSEELDDPWSDFHEFGEIVTCVRLSSSTPAGVAHRLLETDSGLDSNGVSPLSDTHASRSSVGRSSGGKSSPCISSVHDGDDEGMPLDGTCSPSMKIRSSSVWGERNVSSDVTNHHPSTAATSRTATAAAALDSRRQSVSSGAGGAGCGPVDNAPVPMAVLPPQQEPNNHIATTGSSGGGAAMRSQPTANSSWHATGSAPTVPASSDSILSKQRTNQPLPGHRHSNNQSPIHNILRVL
eukprot:scpid28498/ scgid4923/ Enhancer of polycomb homolog 1